MRTRTWNFPGQPGSFLTRYLHLEIRENCEISGKW